MKKKGLVRMGGILFLILAAVFFLVSPHPWGASAVQTWISVPVLCQYPLLPTGCESVAATMVLRYYGEQITPKEFASAWLKCSDDFYSFGGKLYGPDPNLVFAGDPFSSRAYGCFASPIVEAIHQNSKYCTAQSVTCRSLKELCGKYVDFGIPLLIWATMGMEKSYEGSTWNFKDGTVFTWPAREHCLVLVGYNSKVYFLNDPMTGSPVFYSKELVEKRFEEMGRQAVVIKRK